MAMSIIHFVQIAHMSLAKLDVTNVRNIETANLNPSLASRPIAEKLAMLDAMRARHLAIQGWKSPQRLESKSTNGDPSISGGDSR